MSYNKRDRKVNRFVSADANGLQHEHVSINDYNKKKNSFSESQSLSNTWTHNNYNENSIFHSTIHPNYSHSSSLPYSPRFNYILYIFILIILFDLLSPFTTDIYNPILPIIINKDNLDSTPFMIQLSLILFTLFHSFSQIIFTALINDCFKLQYRYIIIIGLVLYCSSSMMCAYSQTIQIFIIARTVQGLGSGFAVLVNNELSQSLYPSFKLYLERRIYINRIRNKSKKHRQENGKDTFFTQTNMDFHGNKNKRDTSPYGAKDHHAYSSILTNSYTNYSQNIDKDKNICSKFGYFMQTTFLLFLLAAIRAILGIASAAPVGALITQQTNHWKYIFLFLTLCGIITGFFIFPLLSTKIFIPEISKQSNGLLGIGTLDPIKQSTEQISGSLFSNNYNYPCTHSIIIILFFFRANVWKKKQYIT